MKKEEFPTFLNEQPKVIFGRTGRELLIMACGIIGGYTLWGNIHHLMKDPWWSVVSLVLAILPALFALVIALMPVADRPLEEWAICWLLYISMPRSYLYKPQEEDLEQVEKPENNVRATHKQHIPYSDFEED
jgi:hypothetical protein